MWCEDRRNGVIIADFAVQGTLAREILGSPNEVMTRAGIKASQVELCLASHLLNGALLLTRCSASSHPQAVATLTVIVWTLL